MPLRPYDRGRERQSGGQHPRHRRRNSQKKRPRHAFDIKGGTYSGHFEPRGVGSLEAAEGIVVITNGRGNHEHHTGDYGTQEEDPDKQTPLEEDHFQKQSTNLCETHCRQVPRKEGGDGTGDEEEAEEGEDKAQDGRQPGGPSLGQGDTKQNNYTAYLERHWNGGRRQRTTPRIRMDR